MGKIAYFLQKIACSTHFERRKIGKKPDIQNLLQEIVASTSGHISTNLYANSSISLEQVQFSAYFFFQLACLNFGKNYRFWQKNGHFSADFAEILGIHKNHLNTSYVKIVGHLGHFLAKYDHFRSFLAHFGLYNYIGENAGRASYRVILRLAFTTISSEPLNRFSKCWAF